MVELAALEKRCGLRSPRVRIPLSPPGEDPAELYALAGFLLVEEKGFEAWFGEAQRRKISLLIFQASGGGL